MRKSGAAPSAAGWKPFLARSAVTSFLTWSSTNRVSTIALPMPLSSRGSAYQLNVFQPAKLTLWSQEACGGGVELQDSPAAATATAAARRNVFMRATLLQDPSAARLYPP